MKAIGAALASWTQAGSNPHDKPPTAPTSDSEASSEYLNITGDVECETEEPDLDALDTTPELTLSAQAQAVLQATQGGTGPLAQAIDEDDPARIQDVLRRAPFLLNTLLANGMPPLAWAVFRGKENAAAFLLKQGSIDPNLASSDGWTPLHWAAQNGGIGMATALLGHPETDVHVACDDGTTPFYLAIAHNHLDMADLLVRAGANIHRTRRGGHAPLHAACTAGHVEAVRWLLKRPELRALGDSKRDRSAVLNQRTNRGITPLQMAAETGRQKVVKLLLRQKSMDPNLADHEQWTALHRAAAKGFTGVITWLLNRPDIQIDAPGPKGLSALFYAIRHSKRKAAELLLDKGADIHHRTFGFTPLIGACSHTSAGNVRWLLKQPALLEKNGRPIALRTVVNQAAPNGVTPLLGAIGQGDAKLVRLLLDHGADPDQIGAEEWTPLHYAVHAGHRDIAKLLLQRDTDIHKPLPSGLTLFYLAIANDRLQVAQWLLARGADIQQPIQGGSTPLHAACAASLLTLRWLLNKTLRQAGARAALVLNHADQSGTTPLLQATSANATHAASLLLKQKSIDPNRPNKQGWAPLHHAARNGNLDVLVRLLEHPGIRVLQEGPHGLTLMHFVAISPDPLPLLIAIRARVSPEVFEALLKSRDEWGAWPASLAAERGAPQEVIDLLTPPTRILPMARVPTAQGRGWVVTGPRLEPLDAQVDVARKAGLQIETLGDGKTQLSWQALIGLPIRSGDFVFIYAHTQWDTSLQRVMMEMGKGVFVPLVDVARMLHEKGARKVVFLGCEAHMGMTPLYHCLTKDPTLRRPRNGVEGYLGLEYTIVGNGKTVGALNTIAVALGLEDCATKLRNPLAAGDALPMRSVQAQQSLAWDAESATLKVTGRGPLDARWLGHRPAEEVEDLKSQLLVLHAFDGRADLIQILLETLKADPNASVGGYTALALACHGGRLHVAKALLQHNADVHLTDLAGRSALYFASEGGHAEVCHLLLEHGANPAQAMTAKDDASTPLLIAVEKGHAAIVQLLLDAGADPRTRGPQGHDAWNLARHHGRTAILNLLSRRQAPSP
ncbi:ankyrin repeat domain-containing protein [Hydrogenophaga sp. BPS33]|uniref:ankyrin repeat domain-containing protein n=1 Tax=Hydrogenophaga sp. BPS33 TaxID=2651974 RepID=UPI00131F8CA2|nr:ankyrin repeat domain-containing protein [Hydrogenophaga sp. BPS33]QHE84384.1 hypothetical protein F9K07_05510 [Hydrogenophaga sp. BPS33]